MAAGRKFLVTGSVAIATLLLALTGKAEAQVKIGIDLALTGPTGTIIVAHQKVWKAVPPVMGGLSAEYPIVDDHGDPTEAVKLVRRLISEDHVDAVLMAGTIPICVAMGQVALETKTPAICAAPVVVPKPQSDWMFTTAPRTIVLMRPAVERMKAKGVKTVGYIGFSDSLGDVHLAALKQLATELGMTVVADERFDRTATSITGQALKVMAANPDAVFIGASGTPASLPQKTLVEQGYKGPFYHTNAVFGPDFIRAGGKDVEGAFALASPFFVVSQLPDSNANKKVAEKLMALWQEHYPGQDPGTGAGYSYDAYLMLDRAAGVAAHSGKPGTVEFRVALRDALENLKDLVGSSAVYNMTPTDHNGTDSRAAVLVQLQDGAWKVAP